MLPPGWREEMVKGGEICVSRGVHDHLRHRGGMVFDDLGEQLVKNIAHPIRAFRLHTGEPAWQEAPIPEIPEPLSAPATIPSCPPTMSSPSSWRFGTMSRQRSC